jgi:hypothetical protein
LRFSYDIGGILWMTPGTVVHATPYVTVLVRMQGICKNFHRFGARLIDFSFFFKTQIKDLTTKTL